MNQTTHKKHTKKHTLTFSNNLLVVSDDDASESPPLPLWAIIEEEEPDIGEDESSESK